MYVCICKQVTDKAIKNAVENGAKCLKDLTTTLSLGKQCGKCCCQAKAILTEHCNKDKCNRSQ